MNVPRILATRTATRSSYNFSVVSNGAGIDLVIVEKPIMPSAQ
jgi:hypothetical protein